MSTASDFVIVPLGPEDLLHYDSQRERGVSWAPSCSGARDCRERILYAASYSYESSTRTGRRTLATQHLCLEHARKWAARRGIELPEFTEPAGSELKGPANEQPSSETNAEKNQGGEHGS